MTEQQQQWDEWNRQDEIERQESLTPHPRTQGDTLKKTVLKIASPWKIFVVQGGNRIKMVLLPVRRFTTCFHGNRDETAELGHSFIFEAWGMGAWDTAPAQQPRPLKGTQKEDRLQRQYPVASPCVPAPETVFGLCSTQDTVPRCTTCGMLNIQTCKKPWFSCHDCHVVFFFYLNAMLILLEDLL